MPEKDPRQIARETGVIVQDALSSISEGVQNIIENALSDVKDVSSATLDDIGKGFKQLSRIQDTLASSGQKALQGDLSRADVAKIMMQRQAKLEALSSALKLLMGSSFGRSPFPTLFKSIILGFLFSLIILFLRLLSNISSLSSLEQTLLLIFLPRLSNSFIEGTSKLFDQSSKSFFTTSPFCTASINKSKVLLNLSPFLIP